MYLHKYHSQIVHHISGTLWELNNDILSRSTQQNPKYNYSQTDKIEVRRI